MTYRSPPGQKLSVLGVVTLDAVDVSAAALACNPEEGWVEKLDSAGPPPVIKRYEGVVTFTYHPA